MLNIILWCIFVGNSVQPLLMVMPSINPLGTVLGMDTFWFLYALVLYSF